MRDMSSFYQICVYICITMVIFNLCVSFVSGMGFYPVSMDVGVEVEGDTNSTFSNITDTGSFNTVGLSGMEGLWIIFLGSSASLGIGLFLMLITHSTNVLGVCIFSGVFWSSYVNTLSIINIGGFLVGLSGFLIIGTVGMLFIFSAAVIGMLSGSG